MIKELDAELFHPAFRKLKELLIKTTPTNEAEALEVAQYLYIDRISIESANYIQGNAWYPISNTPENLAKRNEIAKDLLKYYTETIEKLSKQRPKKYKELFEDWLWAARTIPGNHKNYEEQ